MQNPVGKIYTHCIYIILLILFNNVQNGLTQLNPYFQFIPQNDNLHTKIYDYSEGFDEDSFTYELQYPIPIYETLIKKITIRKNGLLALDSISGDNLPSAYPVNTSITNQRLQDFDGRYLSIFSSVNDGKSGRIRVTEIDLLSPSKLPCVERMQIDRLIKFIHLSYIEEAELKAQYIVHILWENMTNAYLINQKANTYGMIIISNGIRSYAFMQYIQVEWNENDVAENLALPPESGIFMRPLGGYQLPRSSQAVEPNIWLTETNIALHGEWLVPLYKSENIATINVKNLSAVASEFVASLASICKGSLHSLKSNNETPSDTVVIKNVNTENTSEEPIARTHSFKRALENLENYDLNVSTNDYSNGITENVPKAAWNILRDEAEISGDDPFNQNEVNILPENETGNSFYHESNKFVVDNKEHTYTDTITAQTYYPLGRYDGDEERQEIHEPLIVPVTIHPLSDDDDDEVLIGNNGEYKSMNETFSNDLVKCDAVSECNSHNTECYRVDNAACCICSDGFFGAGNAKCWSEVNDHKFSFSGSLTARFGSEHSSSPLHIYLDIQHGSLRRSSSGIRGGQTNDRIYSTIRLITPVFHILNSMISSPCENIPKRERVYNLFTLGNGLQRPFKVLFQFDIERVGKFTIQAILELRDFTTGAYASGVIELEAFSTENLNLLDRSYIEAYSASDKPDKTYYANYKIDDHGRIVFPEQTVKFIVEHRDSNEISNFPEEINVHWSAVAESESCLLKQVSSIPKNEWYYIRLKDRGYCSEDCSAPDGSCNLFCVDEPLLLATEPSPCDCVTCDRHGEVCRPEGASYRCECGQGLKLMPDNTCQATSLVDVANYLGVQCGSVNCHTHARCIDPNQAFCQCLPGYRGDGVSHCENDPCSKCRRNEICENGICIASGVDLCEGVQCGEQAFCQDGACVCTPGYTGDPVVKCYEERDPCANVRCHPYAKCRNGNCECPPDYDGDGYQVCKPRNYDPCSHVQCHYDATCYNGVCTCRNGYIGDGYRECRPRETDLCHHIQCHPYAQCKNGQCHCIEGYIGDGYYDCHVRDPCTGVKCHHYGECISGRCHCLRGYEGDGYYDCRETVSDPCSSVRCHPNGYCKNGRCLCLNGYEGDGYYECRPFYNDPCVGVQCHSKAECRNGYCRCLNGYEGDGFHYCYAMQDDPCSSMRCHINAKCFDGECRCLDGYQGDGKHYCDPIPQDQCQNIRCHEFANCQNGRCQCNAGYEGDGYWECKSIKSDLCKYVRCHENAKCNEYGKCQCLDGYSGDGYYECQKSSQELCAGVQCHRFGQCYENRCYCSHGYVGDGVNFCDARANDPCDGVRCAANGRCQDGRCVCDPGYTGDGYNECREAEGVNLCGNVQCHQYATCDRGQCRCVTGYDGDGYSDCRPVTEDKCSRVRCHPDAQCTDGYCFCPSGFEGDGYYECKRITQDRCANVRCHENAKCDDGYCRCKEDFEGDGYSECRRKSEDPCARIRCHPQAQCEYGFCRCKNGYKGDGYWNCQPIQSDLCRAEQCHQFARCVEGRCRCLDGYEGDGYQMCNIIPGATSADCGNCNGIPFKELAQCVGGRCICARGFIEVQPGVCMECVQDNCHQDAVCRPDERFNGAYSCHCKAGFTGDGVSVCKPESVGREDATSSHTIDPTCGGGCRTRNAECDRYTGTCKCRSGYDGDGERGCYWNCKLCHSSAICDRENERCICPSGYRGDGQTFCERIPVRQDSIKVRIMGEGEVMHITDISHPLELRCFVTGSDQSYSGQWIKPHSAQEPIVTKTRQQDGYEISLLINQPTITDSGRYECRAGNVAAFIDVNVEESAIPFTVLLTSDDGILMTQSTDSNVTKATLWNIAENNKYGRVSMVGDCNSQRIIYTSDYGHTIRWGNSNSGQNKLVTKEIYTSQFNRFRNLAVDSLSGNVFAWEEAFGKIMVFNPNKPNIHYTLESLHSLTSSEQQNFAGLALHSTLGLMYWAIYTDGWRPNGTIQVASMSGENEEQLLQLTGEPLAISISPATPVNGNSAGKLCWMQRSSKGMFGLVTELHCARLGQTGREILTNEKIREFSPSEEPSFGMTQYKGTLLWTDATKTVYYSINPDRRIRVRYVCCSNRFQALSVLGDCPQASTNPCTYSNGRCRYICLPNDGGRSRTCVCPDNEPGCHKEM
uniref:Egf-like domain protein n=1 Tax=Schistosoma mansoni TaxID=6183 RepID=A0A5K4ESR8_SCHMA